MRKFLPQFCSLTHINAFANRHDTGVHEAVRHFLSHGIYPEHFRRNSGLISGENQQKLFAMPIFIAGCGGLGGEIAAHLCQLGAARLYLCDFDEFEESNLNRQRFCNSESLHGDKATYTVKELLKKVPWGRFVPLKARLDENNAPEYLSSCKVVFDCLDSIPARQMLENAAGKQNLTWVYGSVLQNEGFACLKSKAGSAISSLYGENCQESGAGSVLSHVVAGTASLMISLFLKWLDNPDFNSPLIHADFSVPEIEAFAFPE